MMEKYELQKLRELPIEAVAERLGLQVCRHKALCPFHDDHHASLSFHNNKYKCWSCGASGDVISLARRMLRATFPDACHWLAGEHSVVLAAATPTPAEPAASKPFDASRYARYFEHPWLCDEARRFLFDQRRLDPRVVRWCRLTSWHDRQGNPWLQTPYYDRQGQLVGIQNRNLVSGAEPRFRFPRGAELTVYNQPVLNRLRHGDELYIAEGCSDAWAMLSAGHKAIAIPSATLLKRKDIAQLATLHEQLAISFHMYPDNDEPGERLYQQLRQLLPRLHRHQLPPTCKDVSDLYIADGLRQQPIRQ